MLNLMGSTKLVQEISNKVISLLDEAVVVTDLDLQILVFNKAAERVFGYEAEEMKGRPSNVLVPETERKQNDKIFRDFLSEGGYKQRLNDKGYVIRCIRKDGEEFHTNTTILRLEVDGKTYLGFVVRDITEDKKTEDELLKLASTDPLTGAFNRREFTSLAEREARRSRRYDRPLSILMFDLDHFKQLNDTHGHAAGDKALQRFTTICCNALRTVDVFGRWGGEEFVALLPETSADNAAVIAERLRKLVSETEIDYKGEKLKFTVSIGIAQFKANESTLEAPLNRADAAVYDAKKAGRNNIAIYKD